VTSTPPLDRFLALVRKELAADDVRVDPPGAAANDGAADELRCTLADGRVVVAKFLEQPPDRDAKLRRLEMLAGTFTGAFAEGVEAADKRGPARQSIARSLHDELRAIATRAGALNAIVIDANSPVVWGAARPQGLAVGHELPSGPRLADAAKALDVDLMTSHEAPQAAHDPPPHADTKVPAASRRAIHAVRQLGAIASVRKGRHLRHVERGADVGYVAHSFAGIYVLLVVFGGPFEELRAERTVVDALPRVERLVLALPPLDPRPSPVAGVISLRRPRRR
jgi:hypothetical protein